MAEQQSSKKNKGLIIFTIIILAIAGAGIGIWYYYFRAPDKKEHVEELLPNISMSHIAITDIDGEHVKFRVHGVIGNPFPINVNTNRIQYQLYIDTAMVVESSYEETITVKSKDSTLLGIPMEASLKRMLTVLKEIKRQKLDSVNYRVKAQVYVNLPMGGERVIHIDVTRHLPSFLLPELYLADTDFKKLGVMETGFDMDFIIHNPNAYPIKLNNGYVKVTLDKQTDLEGDMENIQLPKRGTQFVTVHFKMNTNRLTNTAWKVLFNKKNTEFDLLFKGTADADNKLLKQTKLVVTAHSTLAEALKTVKEIK